MKKTYVIHMSDSGKWPSSGVSMTIQAETEFEAIREAEKRCPNKKVAKVEVKH